MLLRLRLASGAAFEVTRTMIGGDDDERLLVRPDVAQPRDQITDETVHESDLRQMALVERIGIGRAHSLEQTLSAVHRGLVVRTTVPPSRRDVFERHMRQHQVDEVQPRRLIVNRRHELREHPATARSGSCRRRLTRPTEFRPVTDHRRQVLCELLRQNDVQPHEAKIRQERPDRVGGNRGVLLTRPRRTELLKPHGRKDVVVTCQRRKEIDRVVSQRRHGLVRRRVSSRHDGRHRIGVVYATVLALRNQYASRASAPKFGYRSASMFPPASSRLFMGSSSNTTSTIGGVRSSVCNAAADSDGRKLCLTPGSRRNSIGTTSAAGASAVRNCRTVRTRMYATRDGDADERAAQAVPWELENAAPSKPWHDEGCRQECDDHPVKRRGGAPAHRRESHARSRAAREEVRDKWRARLRQWSRGACSWPGRTLDCSTPPRRSVERWRWQRARASAAPRSSVTSWRFQKRETIALMDRAVATTVFGAGST